MKNEKDYIMIQLDKKLKKIFKKACEKDGQTMTGFLLLKIREKIKK